MEKETLIKKAYEVFSGCAKPKHCAGGGQEEAEFDDLLRPVSLRQLTMEQVGTPAWSPLPLMTAEALAYFMPRLIELAVTDAVDRDSEPFFCFFINSFHEGPLDERFTLFDRARGMIMAETFDFLRAAYGDRLKMEGWYDEALRGAQSWRDEGLVR